MRQRPVRALGVGLFHVGVLTLLLRQYTDTVGTTELGLGLAVSTWCLTVGLGMQQTLRRPAVLAWGSRHAAWLLPACLPVAALTVWLGTVTAGRAALVADVTPSVGALLVAALTLIAPLGLLCGGLLATLGGQRTHPQVALAALGGTVGGMALTLGLRTGLSQAGAWLLLAAAVGLAVACAAGRSRSRRAARWCGALGCFLALGLLGLGGAGALNDGLRRARWERWTGASGWQGAFVTDRAEYLVGTGVEAWQVLSGGRVVDARPAPKGDAFLAALALAQNPAARRVLVLGRGLGLCEALLSLGSVEAVDWCAPDRRYPARVLHAVPAACRAELSGLVAVDQTPRRYLADHPEAYDLVIVNLDPVPGGWDADLDTTEFYTQVAAGLRRGGLALVALPTAAAGPTPAWALVGASLRATLGAVFAQQIVAPGPRTVFVAAKRAILADEPGLVRDRFATVPGAAEVFPADALLGPLRPGRREALAAVYDRVHLEAEALTRHDGDLHAGRMACLAAFGGLGLPLSTWLAVSDRLGGGLVVVVAGAGLLAVLAYRLRRLGRGQSGTGSGGSGGGTGLAAVVTAGTLAAVCVLFLRAGGHLYLEGGALCAVPLLGGLAGGGLARFLPKRRSGWPVFAAGLAIQAGALLLLSSASPWKPGPWWAGALVGLGGALLLDPRKPLAPGIPVGAGLGGLCLTLVGVPLLGIDTSLRGLGVGLAALLALRFLLVIPGSSTMSLTGPGPSRRRWGYALFALGLALVAGRHAAAWTRAVQATAENELPDALQPWVEQNEVTVREVTLPTGPAWFYHELSRAGRITGYIVRTERLAPKVYGFGGPIRLALLLGPEGRLRDLQLLENHETPSYLRSLDRWLDRLVGRRLWGREALTGIHAKSGATYSSEAILKILQQSGDGFARHALGLLEGQDATVGPAPERWDCAGLLLAVSAGLSLAVASWGGLRLRLGLLATALGLGGLWLNAQYSPEQVLALLGGRLPPPGLTGRFVLVLGVPLVLLACGNIYCGYLCPCGALQEFLACLWPARWKLRPARGTVQRLRLLKYVVLVGILASVFLFDNRELVAGDPLVWLFQSRAWTNLAQATPMQWVLAGALGLVVITTGLLSTRFWCRFLCPTGAFLSLCERVFLLRRWRPVYRYGRCEFGLTGADHQDCLACDRCRFGPEVPPPVGRAPVARPVRRQGWLLTALVLLVAGAWLACALDVRPGTRPAPAARMHEGNGQVRDVNEARLRELITAGHLSNHEAGHWRTVSVPPPTSGEEPNGVGP